MILIKLGGSVVTHKRKQFHFAYQRVKSLAHELRSAVEPIVLVHGGGSYGKTLARRFRCSNGVIGIENRIAATSISHRLSELSLRVVKCLGEARVNAVGLGGIFEWKHGAPGISSLERLLGWTTCGFVTVVYSELLLNGSEDIRFWSTDELMCVLARQLKPSLVIFVTDVDGVYAEFPPRHNTRMYAELGKCEYDTLARLQGKNDEATYRGVICKVKCALEIAAYAGQCLIINGKRKGLLSRVLKGRRVKCTHVVSR